MSEPVRCHTCDRAECGVGVYPIPTGADLNRSHCMPVDWRSRALAAEAALVGLLEAMELQEDREGGLAHVTAPTMLALWNKAKERARRALEVSRGV